MSEKSAGAVRAARNREAALARLAARRASSAAPRHASVASPSTTATSRLSASRAVAAATAAFEQQRPSATDGFDSDVDLALDRALAEHEQKKPGLAACQICRDPARPINEGLASSFAVAVCGRCQAVDPESWQTVTKGTAKERYLLTDDTLNALPFVSKPNPKQFRQPMKLYLVRTLVDAAHARWEDAEGLAAEQERRASAREQRVRKRFRKEKQAKRETGLGANAALVQLRTATVGKLRKKQRRARGEASESSDDDASDSDSESAGFSDSSSSNDDNDDDNDDDADALVALLPAVASAIGAIADQDAAAAARRRATRRRLLGNLKVADLRKRCKALGVAVGGKKAALIERILDGAGEGKAKGERKRGREGGAAGGRRKKAASKKAKGGKGGGGARKNGSSTARAVSSSSSSDGSRFRAEKGHVHAYKEGFDEEQQSWMKVCACGDKVGFDLL